MDHCEYLTLDHAASESRLARRYVAYYRVSTVQQQQFGFSIGVMLLKITDYKLKAFLSGHWWDFNDSLKSALIALPKLLGVHSGENIAFTMVEVIKQYAIRNHLGYFMFDNALNNDTAVQHIN